MDRILSEVREEIEEKQRQEGQEVQRTEDSRTVTEDLVKIQEDDVRIGLGYIPSMMGPEMCLTIEEKNVLGQLFGKQITACRNCCPVRSVTRLSLSKRMLIFPACSKPGLAPILES